MFNKDAGPKQKNEKSRIVCTVKSRKKGENLKDCTFFLA